MDAVNRRRDGAPGGRGSLPRASSKFPFEGPPRVDFYGAPFAENRDKHVLIARGILTAPWVYIKHLFAQLPRSVRKSKTAASSGTSDDETSEGDLIISFRVYKAKFRLSRSIVIAGSAERAQWGKYGLIPGISKYSQIYLKLRVNNDRLRIRGKFLPWKLSRYPARNKPARSGGARARANFAP